MWILASLATVVGIVLWLVSYFGLAQQMHRKYQNLDTVEKVSLCLVPNVALTFAIKIMAALEGKGNNEVLLELEEINFAWLFYTFISTCMQVLGPVGATCSNR